MYDPPCEHGYVNGSCAECRRAEAARSAGPDLDAQFTEFEARHKSGSRAGWLARRTEITGRMAELEGYARRSNAQDDELHELISELTVLGSLIDQDDVRVRSETIARGMQAMKDPANREGPDSGSQLGGAPALVTRIGERPESAAETLQRMRSNPWRPQDGLIDRADTAAGLISRAHVALEGLEERLTHDGCERLAAAMAEQTSWPGVTMKRSKDEQAQAAGLWLALSNPFYAEAFRSVLRWPGEFMGAGATGFETLTDEQRQAWRDVRTNEACRAAFAESSGAAGAFAIPLDLHPDIILTNAGSANPFRRLARVVLSTTNVAEFVTSAGSTANWLAEGAAVADTTPTLAQLAITHFKESVWI